MRSIAKTRLVAAFRKRVVGAYSFLQRVVRKPTLEWYIYKNNRLNLQFFNMMHRNKTSGTDDYLIPFSLQKIPKTIWIYWGQGESGAPLVVKKCIASWREKNPSWTIRVLDDALMQEYVDVPELPSNYPRRYRANMLRLALLSSYGGVWIDSTVYCHRPLDSWLNVVASGGFFVFRDPAPDRRIENWFIAASKGNPLVEAWSKEYTSYIVNSTCPPSAYFTCFYIFQWLVLTEPNLNAAFLRSGALPAPQTLMLMSALEGRLEVDLVLQLISNGLPVSKLSWKNDVPEDRWNQVLQAAEGCLDHAPD